MKWLPQRVESVLVEELEKSVAVTWGLGESTAADAAYFGYEVYYNGRDGNYGADTVTLQPNVIVVRYNDADLGSSEIGAILPFSHVDGMDRQTEIPVTLLRFGARSWTGACWPALGLRRSPLSRRRS